MLPFQTQVYAFVSSRIDYCNSILAGVSGQLLQRLQSVQNAAARLVTGARRSDRMTPILRQLHWLPVRQRITFKTAVLVYKCRHGMAPPYLSATASQRHHTAVGVTCALLSPVNSLFRVGGRTTETAVLPFTGQSCGTVFQPISVC